jgi:poly(A) polymerase
MPFTGGDVVALGVPPGPAVGRVLKAFEAWWLAKGFPADRAERRRKLEDFARKFVG